MISLNEFASRIDPEKTVVLLGAGASIPSGAHSAVALTKTLAAKLGKSSTDLSLAEVCSIFEKSRGRKELAQAVAEEFQDLNPTGGLLLLPRFNWARLYGTNYDQLVEKAYRSHKRDIAVLNSNADFSKADAPGVVQYFKLHGDIQVDIGFGQQARMLLTERDYDEYAEFREAGFKTLEADMTSKDILIIGQSLADVHLRQLVNRVAKLHATKSLPGNIFLLTYKSDPDRASLFEDRGIIVSSGGINELMQGLIDVSPPNEEEKTEESGHTLPHALLASTIDVVHAAKLRANPQMLFNGAPATYADIASGLTFDRSISQKLLQDLLKSKPFLTITGAGGVGKTTLSRQLCLQLNQEGLAVWEHNSSFPFTATYWLEYESRLEAEGKHAALYIDDCMAVFPQVNRLVQALGDKGDTHLRVIVSAPSGKWHARTKSPYFFSRGRVRRISRLVDADLAALINLISGQSAIRDLVDPSFSILPRHTQLARLRERCAADMYVCLKNIFASEELDSILLREYADLDTEEKDVYRYVSALEALDAKVHRQLIVRTLNIAPDDLVSFLSKMDEILTEYDIKPQDGLYGWSTRHGVVAKTIAQYKFADQTELLGLFQTVVSNLNPAEWLEKDLARALCREEYGIQRLNNRNEQLDLLRSLAALLPADTTIRHRLVRQFLDMDLTDEASREIQAAIKVIGKTSTLARYSVFLLLRRAEKTEGILDEDRVALLRDAERLAIKTVRVHPEDVHGYKAYGEVGIALARKAGVTSVLEDAIQLCIEMEEKILDPFLTETRRDLERHLRVMSSKKAKGKTKV